MQRSAGFLAALLVLVCSSQVLANGRFPRAQRLVEHPGNPNALTLAATYGLLTTGDRGATWHTICESSYFAFGQQTDPLLEVMSNGTLLVGVYTALRRSEPAGCDFSSILGGGDQQIVPDLTLDKPAREVALAMYATGTGATRQYQIQQSCRNGAGFAPLGSMLPADAVGEGLTLDTAPSNGSRVYVSAISKTNTGTLVRSSDRGEHWESFPIPNTSFDEVPYLAAVHPTNADILYVRTDTWPETPDGVQQGNDGLLYSSDGGQTWHEVFRAAAKMFGFALSPDGSSVLVGYGDPVDGGGRLVDPDALGIYKSTTAGGNFAFEKIYDGSVTCLTWTATGVYVCTAEQEKGFDLGFSVNADFTLTSASPLTPLLRRKDVTGPRACAACTSGSICPYEWPLVCGLFAGCPDGGSPDAGFEPGAVGPNDPSCQRDAQTTAVDHGCAASAAGATGNGGSGGAATTGSGGSTERDASVSDAGSTSMGASAGASAAGSSSTNSANCGCRLARMPLQASGAIALATLLFGAGVRRGARIRARRQGATPGRMRA